MHDHSLYWLGLWYTRYTCDTFRLILHTFQFTMIKGYDINWWTTEEDRPWYFNCLYLLSLDVDLFSFFFISGFFFLRFKDCSHDSINPLTPMSVCHWHLSGISVVDEQKFNNTDEQFQPTTAQREGIDIVWWKLRLCSY